MRNCKTRGVSPAAIAALASVAVIWLLAPVADGAPGPMARLGFTRMCAAARPGRAACAGLARPPRSAAGLTLTAAPNQPGAVHAVLEEHPVPGALAPQELHTAYAVPVATSSSLLQTIAVVDAYSDPAAEADLGVYDRQYGLPACTSANGCFTVINEEGKREPLPPTEGFWAAEISADVQIAHAVCQTCRIVLAEAKSEEFSDLGAAVDAAVAAGATVVNNSYESEGEETSSAAALNAHYNHPGVVITASAGDCGYRGEACPAGGVSFPASSPDVVAVGGTALSESFGMWRSRAWSGTGGGCSSVFVAPLWQTSLSRWAPTTCAWQRLVADVAAVGSTETGISVYDSTPPFEHGPAIGWRYDAGSSVSSPVIAAEFALGGGAHGVEYPALTLYSHAGSDALYDVTDGSNGGCGGATACRAAVGFDGPSGVGSPVGLVAFSTPGAPANTAEPAIAGFAQQGHRLSSEPGHWTGKPTSYSHQWARCNARGEYCRTITNATEPTYTVTAADVGARIRVQEVAGNGSGDGTPAASPATAIIRSR